MEVSYFLCRAFIKNSRITNPWKIPIFNENLSCSNVAKIFVPLRKKTIPGPPYELYEQVCIRFRTCTKRKSGRC